MRIELRGLALLAGVVSVAMLGCSSSEPVPAEVYTVRGEIVGLPEATEAGASLKIRHEAIDDLRYATGEVRGMDSMVMPFEVGEGVALDGLEVGDKIEFDLAVAWKAPALIRVTRIHPLPPDTVLEFREARPPAGD